MLCPVVRLYFLMWVVSVVLMVWCLIEAIGTDEARMRHLPKLWWILLILFFPLAGSIAWLVAGRPQAERPRAGANPAYPEYDRPGRMAASDPARDDDFLQGVRERAEQQRRRYEQQRREQEVREQAEREERRKPQQGEPSPE